MRNALSLAGTTGGLIRLGIPLKQKYRHFDETAVTSCIRNCEMIIYSAENDENFVKMAMFPFQ